MLQTILFWWICKIWSSLYRALVLWARCVLHNTYLLCMYNDVCSNKNNPILPLPLFLSIEVFLLSSLVAHHTAIFKIFYFKLPLKLVKSSWFWMYKQYIIIFVIPTLYGLLSIFAYGMLFTYYSYKANSMTWSSIRNFIIL